MRHRKAGRKLKRTASHRKALLAALSTSLLRHKRITTTVAKAKEARMAVEKIITRAKRATAQTDSPAKGVHARREVHRVIRDRAVVTELFDTIAPAVASRAGGYTRIVKLGQRQGDGAEMAVLELVDFQAGGGPEKKEPAKPKAKAARKPGAKSAAKGGKGKKTADAASAPAAKSPKAD
jgi:large subunit ribosomal protein L17